MTKTLAREKYKQSVSDRNNEVNRGKNNGTIGILNPCENQSNRRLFRRGKDNIRCKIAVNETDIEQQRYIVSFNCKNVKTNAHAINSLVKNNGIIFI